MAFIGTLEDKTAVRELYDSLSDLTARGDADAFMACWAEDCRWTTSLFTRTGKTDVREQWDALWENFEKVALVGNVLSIEIDGETAQTRALAREIVVLKGGGVYKLAGMYEDRLIRVGGRWLFASRDYNPLVTELPG